MARFFFFCSKKFLSILFLLSAIPIAIIIHLETTKPSGHVIEYHSGGWLRECAKWDDQGRRFLVTYFDGGVGEISVPVDYDDDRRSDVIFRENTVVKDVDLAGNASLGLVIDRPRNRILVAVADVFGNRYSALAAYDLSTWNRIFLTRLAGPEDEKTMADDMAVDEEGNAYVTDTKASKIWKVGLEGEVEEVIRSPLFTPKPWYNNLVALNGIVYHPNGYLLVVHTFSGNLYKVRVAEGKSEVKIITPGDSSSLRFGDGMEILSPTRLVVAGNPTRLVESLDDWESFRVVGVSKGAIHRLSTAATVKDGRVYVNHMIGMGYPRRKHVLVEALFSAYLVS